MSFTVELTPSGAAFAVAPDESILDGALREKVLLPYGCRNGACGSCKGRVITGKTEYPHAALRGLTQREVDAGWVLLCQAQPRSNLTVAARPLDSTRDLSVRTLPVRVVRKERLAHDVMGVFLRLPPTERLQYLAGQYVDVVLRDGRRRAFSLANAPHDDEHLVLHIRHVPGGTFSGQVFSTLQERALLRIRGPLGSFFLRNDEPCPRILIAGGTGFAPIKSIVENALHEGVADPFYIYWGVRSARDLYLNDVPHDWARKHSGVTYTPVLSEPQSGDHWTGRTGFVHEAVLEDFASLDGADVYASGPPPMVNAIREAFPDHGLPLERLFSDTFDYAFETGHDA